MADIRAFRAFRYDLGRVGALSGVIAPPYDVIDATQQEALYQKSPYNVIRLILNKEEPGDSDRDNRYTRAARCLKDWQTEGILRQDTARAIYVYQQDFEVEGQRYTRKGFLARVRLEPFGAGRIYAHEETLSGPKADRLKLFRATAMNLSPIFGLFPDENGAIQALVDKEVRQALPIEATDHLGVVSRLWPVTDQQVTSALTGMLGPKPVFIADGHHRYETSLTYREDRRKAGELPNDEAAPNFTLMMLVSMSDPGLIILPTHRLVSGFPGLTASQVNTALAKYFDVEIVGRGEEAAQAAWKKIEAHGSQAILGFGTTADQTWQLARLKDASLMDQLAANHSEAWRGLAVSLLHVLVLDKLLKEAVRGEPTCRYVHLLREVVEAAGARLCDLATLVPPATMDHVARIASGLEKMPPKSTYFYPKLLSGLVLNPLSGN